MNTYAFKMDKFFADLLKMMYKSNLPQHVLYASDDKYVYITPDGYRLFKINKHMFPFDIERMHEINPLFTESPALTKIIPDMEIKGDVNYTGTTLHVDNGGRRKGNDYMEFKDSEGNASYFNKDFLKYVDLACVHGTFQPVYNRQTSELFCHNLLFWDHAIDTYYFILPVNPKTVGRDCKGNKAA